MYYCGAKWEKVERRDLVRRSPIKGLVEQMFLGQYQHAIDNKGRLTIPVRYRDILAADGAYVIQGFDGNLIIMTTEAFDSMYERINRLNITDPNARMLRRLLLSSANKVEVDKVGRILIPQFLRQIAGLDTDTVLVGLGDHFEIWSAERWAEMRTQLEDVNATAQGFMSLDLSTG